MRVADGWRISKRVVGIVSWTGNGRVQTPSDDIVFQLDLVSMRQEGAEGRLNYLKAID